MEILLIVLLMLCLAILVLNCLYYRGLKKLLSGQMHRPALEQKFFAQSIVELKAGQTTIYSLLPVIITLLGFLGYKAIDDVSSKVTKKVTDEIESVSNLDSLRIQAQSLDELILTTKGKAKEISQMSNEIRKMYETVRQSPQKIFVVERLVVSKERCKFAFADLTTTYS